MLEGMLEHYQNTLKKEDRFFHYLGEGLLIAGVWASLPLDEQGIYSGIALFVGSMVAEHYSRKAARYAHAVDMLLRNSRFHDLFQDEDRQLHHYALSRLDALPEAEPSVSQ